MSLKEGWCFQHEMSLEPEGDLCMMGDENPASDNRGRMSAGQAA